MVRDGQTYKTGEAKSIAANLNADSLLDDPGDRWTFHCLPVVNRPDRAYIAVIDEDGAFVRYFDL